MTSFPLIDEKNICYGRAGIVQDLTEVVEMERSLLEQSKMAAVGAMAAGIAHEIRNPLFGISSVAQILAKEVGDRPKIGELAESMLSEITRLNKLLTDLLLYARPQGIELGIVNPKQLWSEIIEIHRQPLDSKKLRLNTDFSPGAANLQADEAKIHQVFLNLLLNALQAAPEGSTIDLKTYIRDSGQWVLELHNMGEVISPEHRSKIFEPFFSTKAEGSGLGLAVCKKIIEEHGGQIDCTESNEKGTTFRVILSVKPPLTGNSVQIRAGMTT